MLADLQELGVPERGSISVEQVDVVLSRAAEAAERAAPGDPANAVVWEQVEELASESTTLTASFMIFMIAGDADRGGRDLPRHADPDHRRDGAGSGVRAAGELLRRGGGAPPAGSRGARSSRCWSAFRSRSPPPIVGVVDLQVDRPHAGRRSPRTDHSFAVDHLATRTSSRSSSRSARASPGVLSLTTRSPARWRVC